MPRREMLTSILLYFLWRERELVWGWHARFQDVLVLLQVM